MEGIVPSFGSFLRIVVHGLQTTAPARIRGGLGKPVVPILPDAIDDTPTWEFNGATLSDRIWANRTALRNRLATRVQQAIVNGETFESLARDIEPFLTARYRPARTATGAIAPNQLPGVITTMGRGQGSWPARRLARTEIVRANSQAKRFVADASPYVRGVKWHVTKAHREADVCDDNERKGVMKPREGPSPPAHPACCCYLELVYEPKGNR